MKLSKMKWVKQAAASLLLAATCVALSPSQAFAESSSNYCYSTATKEYYAAPVAYEVDQVIYAEDLRGVDSLNGIAGMFVKGEYIYIAASDKIIVTDSDFNVKKVLSEYTDLDGNTAVITTPQGLFVTDEGDLYVCEPNNGRVLRFDSSYELTDVYGQPDGLDIDVKYQPSEIVVDSLHRMYIIAKNLFEGILEIDSSNHFQRYFGETTVNFSALDLLWRQLATEEQKAKQSLWLPTEYTSITISSNGFIYASVSSTDEEEPIKLLNVKGSNILAYDDEFSLYPSGDIVYSIAGKGTTGPSSLTYIDCNDYGMYTVLDNTRNRVFTYDDNGNMLFVFGGSGDKEGCFRSPVSLRFVGDNIIVADKLSESITVMKPTVYGQTIIDATKLDSQGERNEAVKLWNQVIEMNPHLELAYDALGKAALRDKNYDTAAAYFKQANSRVYYSKAYAQMRDTAIKENFTAAVVVIVVLIVVYNGIKVVLKKRKKGKVG